MRIKITCDVGKSITFPICYNHYFTGVIYKFLSEADPEYAFFLHEDGYVVDEKHFKLFTFSQLNSRDRRIEGDQITFRSDLTWFVSSTHDEFLNNFANSLMTIGRLQIGKQKLQVKDVQALRTPKFSDRMKFTCLSPITMSTKKEYNGKLAQHYCLPDEPEISDLIRQNLIRKHVAINKFQPKNDQLKIVFDQNYIDRRKGRVTKLINFKGVDIRGILCPFEAIGSAELIEVGYECGFGDKNSAGFGMVEIVRKK